MVFNTTQHVCYQESIGKNHNHIVIRRYGCVYLTAKPFLGGIVGASNNIGIMECSTTTTQHSSNSMSLGRSRHGAVLRSRIYATQTF